MLIDYYGTEIQKGETYYNGCDVNISFGNLARFAWDFINEGFQNISRCDLPKILQEMRIVTEHTHA